MLKVARIFHKYGFNSRTYNFDTEKVFNDSLRENLYSLAHFYTWKWAAALQAEGKPIPPQLRRSVRRPVTFVNPKRMAFAIPRSYENIPYQPIGRVVEISLTIYGYSRLVIAAYRYGQQFLIKYKKNGRPFIDLKNQVRFTIISLALCPSVRRVNAAYKLAFS